MAWRSNKKGLAIVGVFLFLMGVVVPAAFGLLTEKAMDLGVGDLLDKSTNWDESNIANSTYFVDEHIEFFDNQTGTLYSPDIVYDDSTDRDMVMLSTENSLSSATFFTDHMRLWIVLNKTAVSDNVDKIVLLFRIEDNANIDLTKLHLWVRLLSYKWGDSYKFEIAEFNATEAYNNTLRVEIPLDAIKRLKISSATENPAVQVVLYSTSGSVDLDNMIISYKVELYDVKKVNATAASNIMLAVSGVLGWLGALAATPYWNPYANREHRNVRRVGRVVRRIRRR